MPKFSTHPSYDAFADRFTGALIGAHDPRYDDARELFNSMIETRPALDRAVRVAGRRRRRDRIRA